MSKLIDPIPPQAFELIRDRIGEILVVELASQSTKLSLPDINVPVLAERIEPINRDMYPTINISFAEGTYENEHPGTRRAAPYSFDIDTYSRGAATSAESGSKNSALFLHRLMGICMSILSSPIYNTLDFAKPFIQKVQVKNIITPLPVNVQDSEYSRVGRFTLEVTVNETSESILPKDAEGYETKVKINETEFGLQYIAENS